MVVELVVARTVLVVGVVAAVPVERGLRARREARTVLVVGGRVRTSTKGWPSPRLRPLSSDKVTRESVASWLTLLVKSVTLFYEV